MVALNTWLYCGIGYKALDIITTMYLVFTRGTAVEASPFVSDMMHVYGIVPGLILNGTIACILLFVLHKYRQKDLLMIATFLLMIPVIFNTLKILEL